MDRDPGEIGARDAVSPRLTGRALRLRLGQDAGRLLRARPFLRARRRSARPPGRPRRSRPLQEEPTDLVGPLKIFLFLRIDSFLDQCFNPFGIAVFTFAVIKEDDAED